MIPATLAQGQRFGRLTVLMEADRNKWGRQDERVQGGRMSIELRVGDVVESGSGRRWTVKSVDEALRRAELDDGIGVTNPSPSLKVVRRTDWRVGDDVRSIQDSSFIGTLKAEDVANAVTTNLSRDYAPYDPTTALFDFAAVSQAERGAVPSRESKIASMMEMVRLGVTLDKATLDGILAPAAPETTRLTPESVPGVGTVPRSEPATRVVGVYGPEALGGGGDETLDDALFNGRMEAPEDRAARLAAKVEPKVGVCRRCGLPSCMHPRAG